MKTEHKFHYIYKITNLLNGKFYFGMHSTNDLEDGYFGSGLKLKNSISKYGKINHSFVIEEFCRTREELVAREKEVVCQELINDPLCLNLMPGGQGGLVSTEHLAVLLKAGRNALTRKMLNDSSYSESIKTKLKAKFEDSDFKEKNRIHLAKVGKDSFLGKKHTEESRRLMSEKISKAMRENPLVYINKKGKIKKVKAKFVYIYEKAGWKRGRLKNSLELNKRISETLKNRNSELMSIFNK